MKNRPKYPVIPHGPLAKYFLKDVMTSNCSAIKHWKSAEYDYIQKYGEMGRFGQNHYKYSPDLAEQEILYCWSYLPS